MNSELRSNLKELSLLLTKHLPKIDFLKYVNLEIEKFLNEGEIKWNRVPLKKFGDANSKIFHLISKNTINDIHSFINDFGDNSSKNNLSNYEIFHLLEYLINIFNNKNDVIKLVITTHYPVLRWEENVYYELCTFVDLSSEIKFISRKENDYL